MLGGLSKVKNVGEHNHRVGIKGSAYKESQRLAERKRGRYKLIARLSEKWLQMHGYIKREDGKWTLK
jgi:hypothetical protein